METLAVNGEWSELEAALQRVQGAPNDAATNLRYAAIRASPVTIAGLLFRPLEPHRLFTWL